MAADMIPRRLRVCKYMHFDLYTGVPIDRSKSDAVDVISVNAAQRRAARFAKTKAPVRHRVKCGEHVAATHPRERTEFDFGICRTRAAKCLSTPRAVAASRVAKRRRYSIANPSAKASASQNHETTRFSAAMATLTAATTQAELAVFSIRHRPANPGFNPGEGPADTIS